MTSAESHSETGWIIPTWEFSDTVRKARALVGMDQKDFAAAIGVTPGSLAGWESGRSKPRDPVAIAKRIELLTRIPATWILGLHAEHPHPQSGDEGAEKSPLSGLNRRPSLYKASVNADSDDRHEPCEVVELHPDATRRGA